MKSKINKRFMLVALKKAKQGIKSGQLPFGACVVKGNRIISVAHNEIIKQHDITAHAEVIAIREACKKLKAIDLSACIIYSTCEPCPMCFSACHWARISKIVFGTNIDDAKEAGFNELFVSNKKMKKLGKGKIKIKENFLRKENLGLFKIWSKKKNKKTY